MKHDYVFIDWQKRDKRLYRKLILAFPPGAMVSYFLIHCSLWVFRPVMRIIRISYVFVWIHIWVYVSIHTHTCLGMGLLSLPPRENSWAEGISLEQSSFRLKRGNVGRVKLYFISFPSVFSPVLHQGPVTCHLDAGTLTKVRLYINGC